MGLMYLSATGGALGRSWPGESYRQRYGARLKPRAKAGDPLWEERGAKRAAACSWKEGEAAKSCSANGDSTCHKLCGGQANSSPVTAILSLFDTDLPFSHAVLLGL